MRTEDGDPEIIIEMNHFLPMMFLLLSGLGLTIFVAIFEMTAGRWRRSMAMKKRGSYFVMSSGKKCDNTIKAFKKR